MKLVLERKRQLVTHSEMQNYIYGWVGETSDLRFWRRTFASTCNYELFCLPLPDPSPPPAPARLNIYSERPNTAESHRYNIEKEGNQYERKRFKKKQKSMHVCWQATF